MSCKLLAVDTDMVNFERILPIWEKHNITLIRVSSMQEALQHIHDHEYVAIGINSDCINYKPNLGILRDCTRAPIHVVTMKFSYRENLEAIKLGADVYAEWLPNPEESVVRGIALFNRYYQRIDKPARLQYLTYGGVFVCSEYRKVFIKDSEVVLRHKEYDLLVMLLTSPKRVYTYSQIYETVWGDEYTDGSNDAIWSQVKRLRQKLSLHLGQDTLFIKNIHNIGYSFDS